MRTPEEIGPVVVAAYIENHQGAAPTVKQHLAAIGMLFDFLVTGQIVPKPGRFRPGTEVRRASRQDTGPQGRPGAGAP